MEKSLIQLLESLQKLLGLHRQLLEAVRKEKEVLIQADVKEIHQIAFVKQTLVEDIQQTEVTRLKYVEEIALFWKVPLKDLTLFKIILTIQVDKPKMAEQFRTSLNALGVLVKRIQEQNQDNRCLIERSLEHIHQMKKNILGEADPNATTYSQQGQKLNGRSTSRIISKEA